MLPEIDVGPVTLQTFGICFALGVLVAGALVARRFRELGKPGDWAYEGLFAATIGGLVGARVDWLIQNWDEASGDLAGSLFAGDGLVWLGGLIGGSIAVLGWARWRGILEPRLFDVAAPALAIGQAIGRVGCQLSGDGDYGTETGMFWGMAYPDGVVPTTEQVHPTPIFETLALGLIAVVLWRLRDRVRPGALFALYLVLAGFQRFMVEFLRRNDEVLVGLTLAQLLSAAMIVGGAVWLARLRGASRTAAPAT